MILAALAAATVAAFSCTQVEKDLAPQGDGLTLSVSGGEMATRADGSTFESNIAHFDFFFFSDAAGTQAIAGMHARATGSSVTLDTREGQPYAALRTGTSYVYMLANYGGAIDHTRDWTLAELLALPDLQTPIVTGTTTNDDGDVADVQFAESLVMDSWRLENGAAVYTVAVTPQAVEEQRTVTVPLTRLAAKVTLVITVPTSVPGTETDRDETTGATINEEWKPVLERLRAYFVNALNAEDAKFTYPELYPMTRGEGTRVFTTDPFYTYPQEWDDDENAEPYIKIAMPWISNLRGSDDFFYKLVFPAADSEGKRAFERNTHYTVNVELSVVDTVNPYIEIRYSITIVPWADSGEAGGSGISAARFFDVPTKEFHIYSDEELYVPFYSSSTVTPYFVDITYHHYGTSAQPKYFFEFNHTDDNNVTLGGTDSHGLAVAAAARDSHPYKLSVADKQVHFEHELGGVYTERTIRFVIKNAEGSQETVTVHQHPPIEIQTRPGGNLFVNGHFARATPGVHVNGHPEQLIGVKWGPMKWLADAGEYRYHSDDNRYTSGDYVYWNQSTWTGGEGTAPRIMPRPTLGVYGTVEGDWTFGQATGVNPYMIVCSVSAFNESNSTYRTYMNNQLQPAETYRIGDPRESTDLFVPSGIAGDYETGLRKYMYKPSTTRDSNGVETVGAAEYRDWEEPIKILRASTKAEDRNIIAPRFLLSSFYNAMIDGGNTFENAQKRAATYQEAGYPAGRWRLPTEAEIAFMIDMQILGVIPTVWGDGTWYWCADGRMVKRNGSHPDFEATSSSHYNRFVYDLWYWGDEPMADTETYHPNMHLVAPNNQ
jgi:hypothetical protein